MISFNEALNNYYQFKTLYETSYNKEKRDIINNKKLSWNEKRSNFQKLKQKCINCKRPVETIFSRKFNDDGYSGFTTLSAVCGDRIKPCKLNNHVVKFSLLILKLLLLLFNSICIFASLFIFSIIWINV